MCGIAGLLLSKEDQSYIQENIPVMFEGIKYRGPDSFQIELLSLNSAFVHSRLSIQDLTISANQPMTSASGRLTITFNGEIYNHLELRSHNSVNHVQWRTKSDTETLLELIDANGYTSTLGLLRGMFAFGVWDRAKQTLTLVRDRFGEKPLYVTSSLRCQYNAIAFASDIRSLKPLLSDKTIDPKSVHDFFSFGAVEQPSTIYSHVKQIMPGHISTISLQRLREMGSASFDLIFQSSPWYQINDEIAGAPHFDSYKDRIGYLEQSLIHATRRSTLADVPVCVFLSGGIDSSIVASMLQANSSSSINTFTASFPLQRELGYCEADSARKIAHFLGSNHTEVPILDDDLLGIVPTIADMFSEPFADASLIPCSAISKLANLSSYKVALTGDGSDELFAGYNRHRALIAARLLKRLPRSLQTLFINDVSRLFALIKPSQSEALVKLRYSCLDSDSVYESYNRSRTIWRSTPVNFEVYSSSIAANLSRCYGDLRSLCLADLTSYLTSDILVKSDRTSMHAGHETRTPFLDPDVVASSFSFLPNELANKRQGKLPLRHILQKYLPTEITRLPKRGFTPPLAFWLRGPLKEWVMDLLCESNVSRSGLNLQIVQKVLSQHMTGQANHAMRLWTLVVWQLWYDNK